MEVISLKRLRMIKNLVKMRLREIIGIHLSRSHYKVRVNYSPMFLKIAAYSNTVGLMTKLFGMGNKFCHQHVIFNLTDKLNRHFEKPGDEPNDYSAQHEVQISCTKEKEDTRELGLPKSQIYQMGLKDYCYDIAVVDNNTKLVTDFVEVECDDVRQETRNKIKLSRERLTSLQHAYLVHIKQINPLKIDFYECFVGKDGRYRKEEVTDILGISVSEIKSDLERFIRKNNIE